MNETFETGQRINWRSLTFQLLAIVVFPLTALLLLITFSSTTLHQNAMRALVGDRDERAARMVSSAIVDQVQRRANEIRMLPWRFSGTPEAYENVLAALPEYVQADFDAGLVVLDMNGKIISSHGETALWREQPSVIAQGFAALEGDSETGVFISEAVKAPGQSETVMVVMAKHPDEQVAIAGAFFTNPLMEHVFANVFALNQETLVAIVSPDGKVLYQKGFGSQAETITQHAGIAEALAGNHGTTYIDVAGSEHVVAYSDVKPFGWALLIEEPWEQVASPVLEMTHIAPLVMVPVLLLALVAVFFGIRQIVQPLQSLASKSSKLGWGDYADIEKPVGGVLEIRQLQTELIHMAHKLRAAQQSLHNYIGAITTGQEEERRRLARELHDDTIQSLIAFKQRIQLVEMDWEGHPVVQALAELEQFAEQTIENLRRMVSALRPIYLEDLGLFAAINMLANETGDKTGSTIDLQRHGKERRLEGPVELALYRIVQEALSNISHHSGATHVSILITFKTEGIQITIQDNGKGFVVPRSPAEFSSSGHFGLLGMFERAELIGGEIRMDSSPGKGTLLSITAPYAPKPVEKRIIEPSQGMAV